MSVISPVDVGSPLVKESFSREGNLLTKHLSIDNETWSSTVTAGVDDGDFRGDWWKALLAGEKPKPLEQRGTITTLDLFCGPGGLAHGFGIAARELGFDVVSEAAVDEDAAAVKVYASNHNTRCRVVDSVASLVDYQVRGKANRSRFLYPPEMINENVGALKSKLDVVLAGPPCQGHSNLNNHTRRIDPRNELYLTVPAIAIALEAKAVIIENVPGVVHDQGNVVDVTRTLLESAGYSVEGGVIGADRLGWPQTRQRYFLVARKDDLVIDPASIESALNEPEPRSLWWAIEHLEASEESGLMFPKVNLSEENLSRIDWLFDHDAHDLELAERPECHRAGTTYGAVYGRLYKDKPAPTITSGFMTPGRGRFVHPTRRRTLTPGEAARIQGFPDTYNFCPDLSHPASKSQLSKWVGDAVPLPLGHAAALCVLGRSPNLRDL